MEEKKLLKNLNGQQTDQVPFWFMRQAGRYLPEYRELRQQAGDFLDLVYNPDLASEVTLQPIRRFGMDGAILFSDILVIPQALGQKLDFIQGEGPKLDPIRDREALNGLNFNNFETVLSPIYETISQVAQKLQQESFNHVSFIGFAGSPWTVACYMIEGSGSKNFSKVKNFAETHPDDFEFLIQILCDATTQYLKKQIQSGVEIVQLFDSWAGLLNAKEFDRWVIKPTRKIVDGVREEYTDFPIIGFPRLADKNYISYLKSIKINALGIDYSVEIDWVDQNLPRNIPLQGNLDPEILLRGGKEMEMSAIAILEKFSDRPFIFNLGHGVIKETPVENVENLCKTIRNFRR